MGWIIIHDRHDAFRDEVYRNYLEILLSCGFSLALLTHMYAHTRTHTYTYVQVTPGLTRLATKILGPCTLIQAAIPEIVREVPEDYHQRNLTLFKANATHVMRILGPAPGLTPVMPRAAMYIMVSACHLSLSLNRLCVHVCVLGGDRDGAFSRV